MSAPIVVGYDGTEGAVRALAEAIRLARALEAELLLCFAHHVNPLGGEVADAARAIEEHGHKVLREASATAESAGVTARSQIERGRPADALSALAEREAAQLIAVGSYGETPLRGALLGSTAYRLIHIARVPIIVVPAPG
jgi:nucleotide-binding universal stress UspA family protein